MNEKIIIANWKMNSPNLADWNDLKNPGGIEIIICPPFTQLSNLKTKKLKKIELGAQNCFWKNEGAYTGEISPKMLKDLGIKYVIIGHSERRQILGETDEMINKKILAALKNNLIPILCVGETSEQRKKGLQKEIVREQLKKDLEGVSNPLIVAYEPIWAIGTGNYCEPEEASMMIKFIKNLQNKKVIYGGSVNSKNIVSYIQYPEIDGALVGGASLKINEFQKIINEVSQSIKK